MTGTPVESEATRMEQEALDVIAEAAMLRERLRIVKKLVEDSEECPICTAICLILLGDDPT